MKVGVRLSYEERETIENLLKDGRSIRFIAFHLERSRTGIKQEIQKNGGPLHYRAKIAHESVKKRKNGPSPKQLSLNQISLIKEGIERNLSMNGISAFAQTSKRKILEYMKNAGIDYDSRGIKPLLRVQKEGITFEERIEALEQQVKILTEIIRKKHE